MARIVAHHELHGTGSPRIVLRAAGGDGTRAAAGLYDASGYRGRTVSRSSTRVTLSTFPASSTARAFSLLLATVPVKVTIRSVPPCVRGTVGTLHHFFVGGTSPISSRRPRVTCSGGAGIVISSTPSRKVAFAWSVMAPSGNAITRLKLP